MIELFDGNCTKNNTTQILELSAVIAKSFSTVARDFGLTKENAPTNPAFMTPEKLACSIDNGSTFWVYKISPEEAKQKSLVSEIIGCVSIAPSSRENVHFVERLAVIPEYRHQGIGKKLLDFACAQIYYAGSTTAAIAIIEDNKILKQWYERYGFVETNIKNPTHIPFTVCIMEKPLKGTSFVDKAQLSFEF